VGQKSEFSQLAELPVVREGVADAALEGLFKMGLSLKELTTAAANVDPNPTEAQKEVGNYAKGHIAWKGFNIAIETAKGQYRRGKSKDGKEWKTLMKDHYGYIKGTESDADGDSVDVFLCEDDLDSEIVFVINQVRPDEGVFDEHKCVLGTTSKERASEVYLRNYEDGWQGLGDINGITLEQFKWWLEHGDTSKPIENGMFAKHRKSKSTFGKRSLDLSNYSIYPCPHCGGEATNGEPENGSHYRGSARCLDCQESFSVVGGRIKPVRDLTLADLEKRADLLPATQLRPHQEEVAETGLEPEHRSLLYHTLGSGKSLSSLAAAETAGEPYTAITPASLRPNYRKEQEKFTDMKTPSTLASYNSVAKNSVQPSPTLIFDEAQRMRNPNSMTTQNATALADQAKRLYLLSATPIVNHPHDLVPMIRMLTGKQYSPEEFDNQFVDERKVSPGFVGWLRGVKPVRVPTMKNQDQFEKLLKGHVNYYAPDKPEVEQKDERYEIDMSPEQTKLYRGFWDQLPWLVRWKMQNDFPLSRQEMTRLSSFLSGPRQVGLSTYPFMRGKADANKAYQQSPKLQKAVSLMRDALQQDPQARGVAYSNFIDAGLTPYAAALQRAKIPYGMFHGGLNDAARKQVVADYNAGKIRALLLGPSGGEGISLKGTRLLQLLDPHWNTARSDQAIGRGIRYDSHNYLPIQDRNVRVQRFVSKMPPTMWQRAWRAMFGKPKTEDARRGEPGVDTYLEQMANRKDDLNEQFLAELQRIGTKQAEDEEPESLRPFTVAVDLDGTLAEEYETFDPTRIGKPRKRAKHWMEKLHTAGARLIINTVRGQNELVRDWLNEHEIPFDFVNENPDQPPDSSGKLIADIYWDNKAISAAGPLDESGPEVLALAKAGSDFLHSDEDMVLGAIVSELSHCA
jgi:hypothetical protein